MADINAHEGRSGFNCLMMACHLNDEADALKVISLLCKFKIAEGEQRQVDVDEKDAAGNTCLHHASFTNKLSVAQYLIKE